VYLSVGMVLEEGLALDELDHIARTMGAAAQRAGVRIVTGDTKVVDAGHGDGVYITTTGIGVVPEGVDLGPHRVRPGDAVIVSGPIGLHGIAVMSCREGLEFGSDILSDCAPLNGLVAALLGAGVDVHMLRDPTRGGVAASLNEIARSSRTGVEIVERDVPVPDDVRAACGFLGLDPLYVANEGKLVAFVAAADADLALGTMRAHELGAGATLIGTVVDAHPGVVVARTGIGGTRVVDLPLAEQLPRIC
jgi:hydrogenase expression/formation protein HypE